MFKLFSLHLPKIKLIERNGGLHFLQIEERKKCSNLYKVLYKVLKVKQVIKILFFGLFYRRFQITNSRRFKEHFNKSVDQS